MQMERVPAHDEPAPLAEFLAHMHVRRRAARRIFGAACGAAIVIAAVYPAHYRATAAIAIMPSPEFTVRENAGSHALTSTSLAYDQIMEAETEILQSDDLHEATMIALSGAKTASAGFTLLYPDLDPAIRSGAVMGFLRQAAHVLLSPWRGKPGEDQPLDGALRRFSNALRVLPTKDSNVIEVRFTNEDAELSARALNAMLDRYAERRRHIYTDPQLAVALRESDTMAEAVKAADQALTAFKTERGFSDFAAERDLLLKRRSQAAQSLADAQTSQVQSQARLASLDRQIATLPATSRLFEENDSDGRLRTIDAALVDLRARLAAARTHYRDGSQFVAGLTAQIKAEEIERGRMMSDASPSLARAGRNPMLDPMLLSRAQAAADREAGRAQAGAIAGEIGKIDAGLRSLANDETHLEDLMRRREAAQSAYASTSQAAAEQHLTEAEDAGRLANVRIIQPARVPQHQTATKLLICLAGAVLGALAAGGWLIARYLSEANFLTAAGLEHASGLPVLAVFAAEHR